MTADTPKSAAPRPSESRHSESGHSEPGHSEKLDAQEVEVRIVAFIEGELLPPGGTIQRDDDLLSGEIIDSLGALRLADFVQEEFRFQLDPTEFVVENFQNVAVLTDFVCRACGCREGSSSDGD